MDTKKKQFFFLMLIAIFNIAKAQSIFVNATDYKQVIDMMGGDMERSSMAIQNADNKDEIIEWSFADINFNVCRVQYDKNQELDEGVKNMSFYDRQVLTMKDVKSTNPNIKFFATMRTDYDGYGDNNNMPDWIVNYANKSIISTDKYAVFLADYLEFMYDEGLEIDYLSTTKEWYGFVKASSARDIILKLVDECSSRNIPMPKICDQGTWGISAGVRYIDEVAELGTKDLYYGFSSHDYNNQEHLWPSIISKANALGKNLYNDETGTGGGGRTTGEEPEISQIIRSYLEKSVFYEAGLNGEVFFEIWSRGINAETRSIYFPWGGDGRRMRSYYIMKQFANNAVNSHYITSSVNEESGISTMSFRKEDKVIVWVINEESNQYSSLPINIDGSIINGSVEALQWTNNNAIEGESSIKNTSGNNFVVDIQGESINSFVFTVEDMDSSCATLNALSAIEAEDFCKQLGIQVDSANSYVGWINNGDWIKYENVDFGLGVSSISTSVSSPNSGGIIEVRRGSVSGTLIGSITVDNTGAWQNFETKTVSVSTLSGVQDIYLVFKGGSGFLLNIDWFKFSNSQVFTPDPNKTYYIDAPAHNLRLASNGNSEDPYTTATSNISDDVRWKFVAKGNGYWYIQRAAGGSTPRLRTDNTLLADMEATTANGSYTYFGFQEGNSNGTYYITLPHGPVDYKRLQVNNHNAIRFVTSQSTGSWVSFKITETDNFDFSRIEAEDFDAMNGIQTEQSTESGENVGYVENGDWIRFDNINLTGAQSVDLRVSSEFSEGTIEFRTGSANGTLIGSVIVSDTGGWQNWNTLSTSINNANGTQDVYLVFKGGDGYLLNINWLEFSSTSAKSIGNITTDGGNIIIYPNPVASITTIQGAQGTTLEVYDVKGSLLVTKNITSEIEDINLESLSSGIYYVKVLSLHGVDVIKIIKQ